MPLSTICQLWSVLLVEKTTGLPQSFDQLSNVVIYMFRVRSGPYEYTRTVRTLIRFSTSWTIRVFRSYGFFSLIELEDTKGEIRICISKKYRHTMDKRTNNDLQNIHIKQKIG